MSPTPYPRHGEPGLFVSLSRNQLLNVYMRVIRRSRDVQHESSLFYTRLRDIHAVGIVLLQMLLGLDVTDQFSNVQYALMSGACRGCVERLDGLTYFHACIQLPSLPPSRTLPAI